MRVVEVGQFSGVWYMTTPGAVYVGWNAKTPPGIMEVSKQEPTDLQEVSLSRQWPHWD